MTSEQFFKACVNAPPGVRAKIEMLLCGDETVLPHADEDARTCTKAQAGRMLNVSRSTVCNMIEGHELETVTINGGERVLVKSINAFIRGAVDATGKPMDAAARNHARRVEAGRKGAAARLRTLANRRAAKESGAAA